MKSLRARMEKLEERLAHWGDAKLLAWGESVSDDELRMLVGAGRQ